MKHIDSPMVQQLIDEAQANQRKRAFHVFHADDEAFNRMLIAGTKDSYGVPHRHTMKFEVFTYVMGDLTVLEFNDDGSVKNAYDLSKCQYVEVAPMTWHTVLFNSDTWAFMEMALWPEKYDPSDKEFAPWAPQEFDQNVQSYLAELTQQANLY